MKLLYCIYKEYKVLVRDKAALAVMFLMPMALVFIVTIIQDSTFKSVNETSVPLLFVDKDKDSLSYKLENALVQTHFFEVVKKDISEEETKTLVAEGIYLIGIIVPENTSQQLREKAKTRISKLFPQEDIAIKTSDTNPIQLKVFFDPITKQSFKVSISGAIDRIVSAIEMQSMISALGEELKDISSESKSSPIDNKPLVETVQAYAGKNETAIVPNSVQHNVPAWTMFAMFFICIPLAGNIIKEREDGSAFRLLTMPGSYLNVLLGKIALYLVVNLIQFLLMLLVGIYILPMLGLPKLDIGHNYITLFSIALSSGLAATGYGLLIGTVSNSQDQASLFGAVSVVILAALGGVWVPTFVMPELMRNISSISPLNWGLEAFYAVFLRGLGFGGIAIQVVKLIIFFAACVGVSFYYQTYKRMR
ncbi:MAG: ABC transporter permease [Sphingobacteriaceae bacterium]|nr:ABC transporter permease [Sphingobacteriaceae bacterium]